MIFEIFSAKLSQIKTTWKIFDEHLLLPGQIVRSWKKASTGKNCWTITRLACTNIHAETKYGNESLNFKNF